MAAPSDALPLPPDPQEDVKTRVLECDTCCGVSAAVHNRTCVQRTVKVSFLNASSSTLDEVKTVEVSRSTATRLFQCPQVTCAHQTYNSGHLHDHMKRCPGNEVRDPAFWPYCFQPPLPDRPPNAERKERPLGECIGVSSRSFLLTWFWQNAHHRSPTPITNDDQVRRCICHRFSQTDRLASTLNSL